MIYFSFVKKTWKVRKVQRFMTLIVSRTSLQLTITLIIVNVGLCARVLIRVKWVTVTDMQQYVVGSRSHHIPNIPDWIQSSSEASAGPWPDQHRCQTFAHAYVCSRNTCFYCSALAVPTTAGHRRLSKTQTFITTFNFHICYNEAMHGLPTLVFL